jgi:hypothetical protein
MKAFPAKNPQSVGLTIQPTDSFEGSAGSVTLAGNEQKVPNAHLAN